MHVKPWIITLDVDCCHSKTEFGKTRVGNFTAHFIITVKLPHTYFHSFNAKIESRISLLGSLIKVHSWRGLQAVGIYDTESTIFGERWRPLGTVGRVRICQAVLFEKREDSSYVLPTSSPALSLYMFYVTTPAPFKLIISQVEIILNLMRKIHIWRVLLGSK